MTFLGFIFAVLIIGGIFYVWYALANRNGANNAQQGGGNQNRQAGIKGAGQTRSATAMETGTIGELPEGQQGKYVQGNAANSGYIPRNVLNPDHGYNMEAGTIGETEAKGSSFDQSVATIQQAPHPQGQQMQAQQQGQGQHNALQKIGDVFQDLTRSIQSEFGAMGGQQGQQAQQGGQQGQQMQGQQAQQTQGMQMQAQQLRPQTEMTAKGPQGIVQKGMTQGFATGYQQGQQHGPIAPGVNAYNPATNTKEGSSTANTNAPSKEGNNNDADGFSLNLPLQQGPAQVYSQALAEGFANGYEQGQKKGPSAQGGNPSYQGMNSANATNANTTAANDTNTTTNGGGNTGGGEDLTDAIHQAFREEFYNMGDQNNK